jgi:hypothetical protein
MLFRRLQSAFCRLHALHHHASGIGACIHLFTEKVAIGIDKAEALVYIYTNSKLLRQKPDVDLVRWLGNNIFSKDLDPDNNGKETESEGNDDNGNGRVGEYVADGAEFEGGNEGGAERAPNNNAGGGNVEEFDWNALMAEDPVPNVNRGNRSPTPDVEGGRSSHGSKDYGDVPSDDGRSYGNVRNGNDDEMAKNVQNGNDEDTPANVGTGDEVEGPLQGQDINNGTGDGVERTLEGEDNNVAGQSLENVNCMPALEDEGAADIDDNMPLNGVFPPCVQGTATPVGPTLVRLGNERRNASRRPPRHNTIARTNCNQESRTVQSNISFPHSVDGTGTTRTELPEDSTRGNRGAKRSNPSVLPFLETYTPRGASCTPVVASYQGPEASNIEDPLVPRVVDSDQCGWYK